MASGWCDATTRRTKTSVYPGIKKKPQGTVRYFDPITTKRLRPYVAGKLPQAMLFPPFQKQAVIRSFRGFQKFLHRVSEASVLPRMTSKVMRETYITLSAQRNLMDALTPAQWQAGHTSPETTKTYSRPGAEHHKAHARKMADVLYLPTGSDGESESESK